MTKMTYNTQISDCISAAFHDLDWHCRFDEERGLFRAGVSIDGPIQDIQILIHVKNDEFLVFGICPIRADKKNAEMMARMAEFITRANYGLKNGCFEMDYSDGEIRYRSYVDCDGVLPSKMVVIDCIQVYASMFEQYASGIVSMIFTDKSPAKAVEECEDDARSSIAQLLSQVEDDSDSQSDDAEGADSPAASDDASHDLDRMFSRLMARLGTASD